MRTPWRVKCRAEVPTFRSEAAATVELAVGKLGLEDQGHAGLHGQRAVGWHPARVVGASHEICGFAGLRKRPCSGTVVGDDAPAGDQDVERLRQLRRLLKTAQDSGGEPHERRRPPRANGQISGGAGVISKPERSA